MRVDSHVHIWRAAETPTPGVRTSISPHSDVPHELLRDYLDEHRVDRAVLVQPVFRGEDNSYVADCAQADPLRLAAVCVVDPREAQAAQRLTYWVQERGCKGLRLRPRIGEESASFGDPATYPLWQAAADLGVVVSVLASQEHLVAAARLAERFSQVPIVIDHLAHPSLPAIERSRFQPLLDLALYPQVSIKLSGYYYFSQERFPYDDCENLLRAVYDAFGPQRLLWGSDFPHVLLHTGFARSVRFLPSQCDWLTAGDVESIMGANAARLYWTYEAAV